MLFPLLVMLFLHISVWIMSSLLSDLPSGLTKCLPSHKAFFQHTAKPYAFSLLYLFSLALMLLP